MNRFFIVLIVFVFCLFSLFADITDVFQTDLNYAQVLYVKVIRNTEGLYDFYVTVLHNDEDWDHYADIWQIVDYHTGWVLADCALHEPHLYDQPFTTSLTHININEGTTKLLIRARCNLHGFEGKQVLIDLDVRETKDYIILN